MHTLTVVTTMNDTKQEIIFCKISKKYIPPNLTQNRKLPNNNGRMHYTKAVVLKRGDMSPWGDVNPV